MLSPTSTLDAKIARFRVWTRYLKQHLDYGHPHVLFTLKVYIAVFSIFLGTYFYEH